MANLDVKCRGIMPRSLDTIFAAKAETGYEYKVELAYVQIYMEMIQDLLDTANSVEAREDPKKGFVLTGAKWMETKDPQVCIF